MKNRRGRLAHDSTRLRKPIAQSNQRRCEREEERAGGPTFRFKNTGSFWRRTVAARSIEEETAVCQLEGGEGGRTQVPSDERQSLTTRRDATQDRRKVARSEQKGWERNSSLGYGKIQRS